MSETKIEEIIYIPRISIQVFCETTEVSQLMQNVQADRRMEKAQIRLSQGGMNAALEAYRENPTPNLIAIESDNRRGELIEQLAELSQYCDEGTKVVVLGRQNDIMLYRRLIEMGISDYLILPLHPLDLVKAIAGIYDTKSGKSLGRITAIMGAKGGVGASTVTHNLGLAFSRELARSTCLVDLNLPFGTMGLNFNQDAMQSAADVLLSPERVDSALIDRLMSKVTDNLSMLATPALLDRPYDFTADSMEQFLDSIRGSSPNIILDMPNIWTGWTKKAMVLADDIVIVAEPDLANLRNLKNLYETLKAHRPHDRPPHYILNNVGMPRRPEIKASDFAKAVEDEPMAIIPHDPAIFGAAANNGQMIADLDPNSPFVAAFVDLAKLIGRQKEITKMKAKPGLLAQLGPLAETWAKLTKRA